MTNKKETDIIITGDELMRKLTRGIRKVSINFFGNPTKVSVEISRIGAGCIPVEVRIDYDVETKKLMVQTFPE